MLRKSCTLLLLLVGVSWSASTQTDSLLLDYNTYLQGVLAEHPIAAQADLALKRAAARQLGARGGFDPLISAGWNEKQFDEKNYYQHFDAELRLPTRLGVDIVAGYENNDGIFLNPEETTDRWGLWNVGLEVNLLEGLTVDARRTALQQARIFGDMAENERQLLLNDLLYDATIAYLDWQNAFYRLGVRDRGVDLALEYLDITRVSFRGGEKSAIDTLEAHIAWQDQLLARQAADVAYVKAIQNVENYLWQAGTPMVLRGTTYPQAYAQPMLDATNILQNASVENHPELQLKQNSLSFYQAEQRLKRNKLLPKLSLKYNPLLATSDDGLQPSFSRRDYKFGVGFSTPLFVRAERGAVQEGEVKIAETVLELQDKRNMLTNKLEASRLQQALVQNQLGLQRTNVAGYQALLEAEQRKMSLGESSVFLLNKRQEKYIDGLLKLLDLEQKYRSELLNVWYYGGGVVNGRL